MSDNILQSLLYDDIGELDPDVITYREYLRTNRSIRSTQGSSRQPELVPPKVRRAWWSIRRRCNDQKYDNYKYYGGRGIRLLFKSFEEFYKEIGNPPSPEHTVDRINNDGNYEPGNVRWATRSQQARNKRPFEQWAHRKQQPALVAEVRA